MLAYDMNKSSFDQLFKSYFFCSLLPDSWNGILKHFLGCPTNMLQNNIFLLIFKNEKSRYVFLEGNFNSEYYPWASLRWHHCAFIYKPYMWLCCHWGHPTYLLFFFCGQKDLALTPCHTEMHLLYVCWTCSFSRWSLRLFWKRLPQQEAQEQDW